MRYFAPLLLFLLAFQLRVSGVAIPEIRKSLVRISTTSQEPNYRIPWASGSVSGGTGAGFVIEGHRILTNAHVVSNARFLTLKRENDPKNYIARVEHIGHDCDLAVLKVDDPKFFDGTAPLPFSTKIPQIESSVSVYGYPIGGERLSVTTGVVSRVDFQVYSHSGVDAHLTIQTNAAINPGNSGGPVLQDDKVVGVAFQGYSGDVAQNVGYMIPTSVVERFLKDIADGTYDRYMDLCIGTFPLINPAQRRALGLADEKTGILVSDVVTGGASDGVLKPGDVILGVDGHEVESDGFVELDGERVKMPEIVERKFRGESVDLRILREKKESNVRVTFDKALPYRIQANQYGVQPRYVLFGGLLFQPLSSDFLDAYRIDDLRVRFFYNHFLSDEIFREHPEILILSAILPDPINTYLDDLKDGIVDEVNGVKIKTLKELSEAFAKPAGDYVIKMIGQERPIVLERAAVEAARQRILTRYNVRAEQNLSDTP